MAALTNRWCIWAKKSDLASVLYWLLKIHYGYDGLARSMQTCLQHLSTLQSPCIMSHITTEWCGWPPPSVTVEPKFQAQKYFITDINKNPFIMLWSLGKSGLVQVPVLPSLVPSQAHQHCTSVQHYQFSLYEVDSSVFPAFFGQLEKYVPFFSCARQYQHFKKLLFRLPGPVPSSQPTLALSAKAAVVVRTHFKQTGLVSFF